MSSLKLTVSLILVIESVCIGIPIPLSAVPAEATGVALSIDFGNGTVSVFNNLDGTDVLDITMSVAEVEMTWQGDLAFVTSIDGVANQPSSGRWWQFWVNGELGGVAANKYQILDSDSIEWRLIGSAYSDGQSTLPDVSLLLAIIAVALVGVMTVVFLYRKTLQE